MIFWMKFSSHGTYIRPKSVVEIARMPNVLLREINCRTHRPRTNKMRKPVSKSFARAGELLIPRWPVKCKKVPTISSTPPKSPHHLKQTRPRFSTSP